MKSLSCFLYVLFTIIYSKYASDTMMWYGFGQLTLLLFICVLGVFVVNAKPNSEIERLFLWYVIGLTFGRALYTAYCVFMDDVWVVYNTDVFNFITYVTSIIFLLYVAYKYSTLKKCI